MPEDPDRNQSCNGAHDLPPWLKHVRDRIRLHFRERLSLRDLAHAVSVHPAYLARQFRRHVGMSIGQFIRLRRVEFARHELATSGKRLVDIAIEAGFGNQAHFTTVFKRLTGMTPLEYRNRTR